MAEDRDKGAPSLEPPSLFARNKKQAPPAPVIPAEPQPDGTAPAETADQVADVGPTTIFDEPTASESEAVSEEPQPSPEPREPRGPWMTGRPAVVVAGLLVGTLIVAATAGSLRLCTAVKGTSSCGGPGFFLLVAILIVAALVATALLRAARVPEPGSTSVLAIGLLSVVALLFLVDELFQWWMIIVIPLVSVAMFLLSYWVTANYIDPSDR